MKWCSLYALLRRMPRGQSGHCCVKRPLGWRYRLAAYPDRASKPVIAMPRMAQTVPAMQAKQLLASSCVIMAAGAMISLSVAVSPSLTLLPPRPPLDVNGNVTSQQHRPVETVGAAIADKFERRWQASNDMPLMPVPARDPLIGLIGGTQIGPHDFAPSPQPDQQIPSR